MKIIGFIAILLLSVLDIFFAMRLKVSSERIQQLTFVIGSKEKHIYEIRNNASYLKDNLFIGLNRFNISDSVIGKLHLRKPLLILRIHKNDCNPCVTQSLEVLAKRAGKLNYNVAVFADYSSEDAVKQNFSFSYPVYIIGKNDIEIDKKTDSRAYYFVLEKDNQLHNVFMPQSGRMNLFEEYLDTLQE